MTKIKENDQGVLRLVNEVVDEFHAKQEELIPILMRIPLDRRIAEAYSEGEVLVKALPEYRTHFVTLWKRLKESARCCGGK